MGDIWRSFRETFWEAKFWLPQNRTWKDMLNTNPLVYKPQLSDLWISLYIFGALFIIRKLFDRFMRHTFRNNFRKRTAAQNTVLEAVYCTTKAPNKEAIKNVSTFTTMNVGDIEKWFQASRKLDPELLMQDFNESAWRFLYHSIMLCFGFFALWDKPWFWDTHICWRRWPEHHVTPEVFWYYLVHFGYFLFSSLSVFTVPLPPNCGKIIVYQAAGLCFLFYFWLNNLTRIGSLVLFVHGCTYSFLEEARMSKHVGNQNLCITILIFFVSLWLVTRLFIFPLTLLKSTLFQSIHVLGRSTVYYLCNAALIVLQIFYIKGSCQIMRVCQKAFCLWKRKKDSRGSDGSIGEDKTVDVVKVGEMLACFSDVSSGEVRTAFW